MRVKQLLRWGEVHYYVCRLNRNVYMLYPEGENMLMVNNREYTEVAQAFDSGVPFIVLEEEDG